jgi:spore germination protein KA
MFWKKNNKELKVNSGTDDFEKRFSKLRFSKSLETNIKMFKDILIDDDTLVIRSIENQENNKIRGCLLFFNGMVNKEIINENVLRPLLWNTEIKKDYCTIDIIKSQVINTHNIEKTSDINKIIEALYNGDVIFLLDGSAEALILFAKGFEMRPIEEPETEKVLRGPREGFTETFETNLSLIKRKLKTPDLKLKTRVLGEKTRTKICICYLDGIANKSILDELNKRLDKIDIDGILDSGYIQELIKDSPYTPFKTIGSTERPDIVAAKMLEGRIAIVVEGSPVVLTLPHIFIEYFQSNDDYYINFYISSITRVLRALGFIFTISIPAIYLALVTYHPEIIPAPLLFSISSAREGVPFPTILEALLMLMIFEILSETSLRMPTFMGQALSIVGALVIGTAAIDARLASAPMVIVVGFTGITGLIIPRLRGASILIRLAFVLLASVLGLYGFVFGMAGLLIHLFEIRSFGVPYMYKLMFLDPAEDIKDTVIRAPWWHLKYRPELIAVNKYRQKINRGKKQ